MASTRRKSFVVHRVASSNQSKRPKEECDDFFKIVFDAMSNNPIAPNRDLPTGVEAFFKTTWLYGYANRMHNIGPTPNGVGMLKLLSSGTV